MKKYNKIEVSLVEKEDKILLNKHKSYVVWFTGLSGSGKSTLAKHLEKKLYDHGIRTVLLDGDNLRNNLNKDLGFSMSDRAENIRRVSELAKLFIDSGIVTLSAFISPIETERNNARINIGDENFIEVFCSCSIEKCMERDKKQLYKNVALGNIKNFTGVDSKYEIPKEPELVLHTDEESISSSINQIMEYLITNKYINKKGNEN